MTDEPDPYEDLRHRLATTNSAMVSTDVPTARRLLAERDALAAVAHAAWHLMDDSGESETDTDDHGDPFHEHFHLDHERLSEALDAMESSGWDAHPDPEERP